MPILEKISRSLGASVTVFWGLFGTPCPLPRAVTYVRGRPLGLPKVDNPSQVCVRARARAHVCAHGRRAPPSLAASLPILTNPHPHPRVKELVEEWHKKYCAEVKRIFDTYKHLNPDYANKNLTIVP